MPESERDEPEQEGIKANVSFGDLARKQLQYRSIINVLDKLVQQRNEKTELPDSFTVKLHVRRIQDEIQRVGKRNDLFIGHINGC